MATDRQDLRVRVPVELRDKVRAEAQARGLSESKIVERALEIWLLVVAS